MSPAGYSDTPLAKKLGYKRAFVAHLENAPDNYAKLVDPVPERESFGDNATGANLVHLFTKEAAELVECLPHFMNAIQRDGMIWVRCRKVKRE